VPHSVSDELVRGVVGVDAPSADELRPRFHAVVDRRFSAVQIGEVAGVDPRVCRNTDRFSAKNADTSTRR
jgi:hypothetical protein